MGERLEFGIDLNGTLAANAQKGAAALNAIVDRANRAQDVLDKLTSARTNAAFEKQAAAATKASKALGYGDQIMAITSKAAKLSADPKGFVLLKKSQADYAEKQKKLLESAGLANKKTEGIGAQVSEKLGFGAFTAANLIATGIEKGAEFLIEAGKKVVEVVTEGFKFAVESAAKEQKLQLAYSLSLGGRGGGESLEDVGRFSKLTQFTRGQSAAMFLPLRRAGFDQKAARQAFATAADVEASGGSASSFLSLAEHVKLKGGVTAKALSDPSIGFNVPEFYKSLGKKLGLSASAAEKKASEVGGVNPQLILNELTAAQNRKQGGAAGTGAQKASETLDARLQKIRELPEEYLGKLANSPAFARLTDAAGKFLEKLDPDSETGKRIQASLGRMFDRVTKFIGYLTTDEGLDKFAKTIERVVAGLENAVAAIGKIVDAVQFLSGPGVALAKEGGPLDTLLRFTGGTAQVEVSAKKLLETAQDASASATAAQQSGTIAAGFVAGDNPVVAAARAQGKQTNVNIPNINIEYHAAKDEDPTHSAQKMAQEFHRHVSNALERAVNEGGG